MFYGCSRLTRAGIIFGEEYFNKMDCVIVEYELFI